MPLRSILAIAATFLLMLYSSHQRPLPAQQVAGGTAVIEGTVRDRQSQMPLSDVQVFVAGGTVGARTDAEGRYRISGLPAGTVELHAKMLGYSMSVRTVTLQEGQTAVANFALDAAAISLDAVVVTGTPGGTQSRAIGNAVEQMDVAKVAEVSPSTNVQQVIGQRNPGVVVLPSTGMVGSGSAIRIRGASSLSLTNQPIIYVDGVRVDADPAAGPAIRQGRQAARLNDFNSEDIESIEIIKGPAAATLYGTEASGGVVQIITKRGKSGKPRLDLVVREGMNFMQNPAGRFRYTYYTDPVTQKTDSFNIYEHELATTGKSIFRTGRLHSYNASLGGGTDAVRYYLSGDFTNNGGILDYNWEKSTGARANVSLLPHEMVQVNGNLGFVRNETRFAQAASGFGIWDMMVYSSPGLLGGPNRGFRYANADVAGDIDSRSKVNRFTGGIDVKFTPFAWLTQQLKAGMDVSQTTNQILFPRVPDGQVNFFGAKGTGEKTLENVSNVFNTLDFATTAKFGDSEKITTATSVGVQFYRKQFTLASAVGNNFPVTDVTTIGGAATSTAGEDYVENKTLGMYVQEELGWRNRLFLTAAVRGDGNSAFGEDFEAAYYPKVSATWVVTEEPFWRWDAVNTLRLRSAWGQAGQQPDAFDAITLYQPTTGPGDVSAITPMSLGNPKLKPERGSELEVGFDAGFFNDRLSASVTHYRRNTRDAIVRAPISPSVGFPGVRVVNLGEVKNWGTEIGINARALTGEVLSWDIGVNYATAHNEVMSLGGLEAVSVGGSQDQQHRVGFPVGSIFWERVVSAEWSPGGTLINVLCDGGTASHAPVPCADAPKVYWGQPTPTWYGSINNTFTLFGSIRLGALIDFQGGMTYIDGEIQAGHQNFQNTAASNVPIPERDPIFAAYQSVVPRTPLGTFDASFAKLRELSLNYTLPPGVTQRLGTSAGSVTAAWRNVATLWQADKTVWGTKLFDPEMRPPGSEHLARYQTQLPPFSQFVITARLSY